MLRPVSLWFGIPAKHLASIAAISLLCGCVSVPDRVEPSVSARQAAQIVDAPDLRIALDADPSTWQEWRERFHASRTGTKPVEMLSLSSGSDLGAFGAGYLVGWSASGTRPTFDIVSGASTGALIAPYAFLGSDYDDRLRRFYTQTEAKDVYRGTPVKGLLGGPSLASSAPLAEMLAQNVTASLLDEIATEHAKGRRLLVQTTDLDSQRGYIWDMGAIASWRSERRVPLFRQVLLASASIPAIFPPVRIGVANEGTTFNELHVDGGTVSSFFALPPALLDLEPGERGMAGSRITVIYNGRLDRDVRTVEPRMFEILRRTLDTMIGSSDRRQIKTLEMLAEEGGIDLQTISIEDDFILPEDREMFDPDFMTSLFEYGSAQASLRR